MKTIHYLLIIIAGAIMLTSCKKDTMKDVDDGNWNHEKNIVDITFENQVGMTNIERDETNAIVKFKYNLGATGSLKIPIKTIVPSFKATASVKAGETLNFDNNTNSATITITSIDGGSLDWTIIMTPFTETLEGVWNIKSLKVFGGTGHSYGGAGIKLLEDTAPVGFNPSTGPVAEIDNSVEFKRLGFTDSGNSYGEIIHNAGVDGKYAEFVFDDGVLPVINCEKYYRIIPTSGGTWERDYAQNVVIIKDATGKVTKVQFTDPGYEWVDWLNKFPLTFATPTLHLNVAPLSADEWSKGMYTLWNMIAQRPMDYWIILEKVN